MSAISELGQDRIRGVIEKSTTPWRKLNTLADELDADEFELARILDSSPNVFIKSRKLSSDGQPLYSTRKHYLEKSDMFSKMMGALRGRLD